MTRPDIKFIQAIADAALGEKFSIEPVNEGISTHVYRLVRGTGVFYLRVLPEEGATFAPEAAAHRLLRRQGVRIPEVVYWEDLNPVVRRSVMITSEIEGKAIEPGLSETSLPGILRSAGRDLACINTVPVDGFGWIRRDVVGDEQLRGQLPTEREFMLLDLDRSLAILEGGILGSREIRTIRDLIRDHSALLDADHAHLAHGDFDVSHIFSHQGRYGGIIDLGEIRGTGPYYDLGHFRFHDGETIAATLLPYILEGYSEIAPPFSEADRSIALNSLLIGVGFLSRYHSWPHFRTRMHAIAAIERDLKQLVA